jgi:hypothetical protein
MSQEPTFSLMIEKKKKKKKKEEERERERERLIRGNLQYYKKYYIFPAISLPCI